MPTATPEQGYPRKIGNAYALTRRETIFERYAPKGFGERAWTVWTRRVDQTPEQIAATLVELAAEFPKLKVRARTFNVTRVLTETQEV